VSGNTRNATEGVPNRVSWVRSGLSGKGKLEQKATKEAKSEQREIEVAGHVEPRFVAPGLDESVTM
jgi:hypothetical protein